ncbi:CRISPR-associated helicase Cas3 [uncultured spirochete]|uniref:CRISPR-associated helicase Cas3 n=1 Tax=uncultured spirochete TaxID=156406 RepID=A0A3P3XK80_9SPIR|nr:CRISPR-associated endonuclease Cas3'' [Rectinema subterraneum]SLM14466.1 CRISPR-associated helicase Cas3 [uncultured spirochete]
MLYIKLPKLISKADWVVAPAQKTGENDQEITMSEKDTSCMQAIAHVRKNPDGSWAAPHSLQEHIKNTATRAAKFAESFNSSEWARSCGILHDAGKARDEWQLYLRRKSDYWEDEANLKNGSNRIEHSASGAKYAEEVLGKGIGRILSYCIAGHHAGLPDLEGDNSSLLNRFEHAKTEDIQCWYKDSVIRELPDKKHLSPPWKLNQQEQQSILMSLWIRMLFSCLVDADYLDTESYMEPERVSSRGKYPSLSEIKTRFDDFIKKKIRDSLAKGDTPVNQIRRHVLDQCRLAGSWEPGFFSLTVPTGGGKTLSSMAFALEHAIIHKKERVIYVIPYTSIIEQNANEFRKALGNDAIIEHHSNIAEDVDTGKARLAAENWEAPVIVTTTVQFFESLFAAKPGRCRKLHNIANSIVIFDEAQLVPPEHLKPILETLDALVAKFRVSAVFCTATQPVFEKQKDFPSFPGLSNGKVREIIKDVPSIFSAMRRVAVKIPEDLSTPLSWEKLADALKKEPQVLCIVSDRRSCRELHALMPEDTYHLSALMCAQHRSEVINEIKGKLKRGDQVRVISTQLIEAGVDIDFPIVYRAIAGLDSIAQSAGRCNREGYLNASGKLGRVVLFIPPRLPPQGILRKASETTLILLKQGLSDPISHEAFKAYFSELYWKLNSLDLYGICDLLYPQPPALGIMFRTAADKFRIIDDSAMKTILIPYEKGASLIRELKQIGPSSRILRKLQRYTVNVYANQFERMRARESIEEIFPRIFVLRESCMLEYSLKVGLLADDVPNDPQLFIG